MSSTDRPVRGGQYLSFEVAGEEYALPILRIREIIAFKPITPVPSLPAYVRGVFNLRGAAVPVLDLAVKLGMSQSTVTKRTCFIIIEWDDGGEKFLTGILADTVRYVIDLDASSIEPPPQFGTRMQTDYLEGMARVEERFSLILAIDRILRTSGVIAAAQHQAVLSEPNAEATTSAQAATGG